jgi:hypothetical protein
MQQAAVMTVPRLCMQAPVCWLAWLPQANGWGARGGVSCWGSDPGPRATSQHALAQPACCKLHGNATCQHEHITHLRSCTQGQLDEGAERFGEGRKRSWMVRPSTRQDKCTPVSHNNIECVSINLSIELCIDHSSGLPCAARATERRDEPQASHQTYKPSHITRHAYYFNCMRMYDDVNLHVIWNNFITARLAAISACKTQTRANSFQPNPGVLAAPWQCNDDINSG